ncbi:sensor domain-containing diguanylate cyclase [Lignipirellula cremea]|uniref:Diguanylate cyclase n=1 Tax=Lignipirellula cremea TaxID=2528010 RepID=A0A518DR02_9BACT|nr:HDOD domain-containing protein [Lignipirellula cremea]QDU94270.1 diguanylate cyclase [Lignipirellula cremea]
MNGSSILHQFVEQAQHLYSLPAVAVEVLALTQQESVDLQSLKTALEKDPALTAKILRVVNSSLFGLSRQVGDLKQALAMLGVKPLKLLVLGFSLPPQIFSGLEESTLEHYWRRSLTKAIACRDIYEKIWKGSGDEAFIAGLLQGIGMLVLIQDLGESYATFWEKVRADGGDLLSLEVLSLGFDHQVLSARLLESWQLPATLVAAVGARSESLSILALGDPALRLPLTLHLAELLTAVLVDRRMGAFPELEYAIASYDRLALTEMEGIVAGLEEKVDQLAEVLTVRLSNGCSYIEVLSQAQQALTDAASDQAQETAVLKELAQLQHEVQSNVAKVRQMRSAPPAAPVSPACPLSELPSEQSILGRLEAAVVRSRQEREPLSVLLFQIDRFDDLVLRFGLAATKRTVSLLTTELGRLADMEVIHEGDGRYLLLANDYDRPEAVALGRRLTQGVCQWASPRGGAILTVSCGLACVTAPPRNFPAQDLLESAERCLYGAQAAGGNTVKSIEIF